MSSSFSFDVQHRDPDTVARTGILRTAHGSVHTPAFVGVATRATIKALEPQALVDIGLQIVISNTYHLHLQPGEDIVASLGGLHGFSGWEHPTMTDSGGFQVFSLGASKEHGVGKVASIFPGAKASAKLKIRPNKPLVKLTEQGVDHAVDGPVDFMPARAQPMGIGQDQPEIGRIVFRLNETRQQREVAISLQDRLWIVVGSEHSPGKDAVGHVPPTPTCGKGTPEAEYVMIGGQVSSDGLGGAIAGLAVDAGIVGLAGAEFAE